jgi:uncharacterized radical SAM protein YgiQ
MTLRVEEIPLNASMMTALGWSAVDVVLITGDAFVDHPAFGAAVIARVLLAEGFKVGVIARPDWKNPSALNVFGRPRLFAGVTSGNLDSMLARYTAFGKVRNDDPWAPDNQAGGRPERATLVYANLARAAWPGVPLVLGGIEASMRRFPHYDFREAKLRRSIALDARADLLVYGSGEEQTVQAARRLSEGRPLDGIPGTVCITGAEPDGALLLPAADEVMADKSAFNRMMAMLYRHGGSILAQPCGGRFLVQYPRDEHESYFLRLETLPFTRRPSALYAGKTIPACAMIENSVTAHRGCVRLLLLLPGIASGAADYFAQRGFHTARG